MNLIEHDQYNIGHTSNAPTFPIAFDAGCVRTRLHVRQQVDQGRGQKTAFRWIPAPSQAVRARRMLIC